MRATGNRRVRLLGIGSAVATGLAGMLALSAGVMPAQAAVRPASAATAVTPAYTCPTGDTCFFTGDNYNGNAYALANNAWNGTTYSFSALGIPHPGSAHVNGGSTLWLYDEATGESACVYDGKIVLHGSYGYFEINYGENTCS